MTINTTKQVFYLSCCEAAQFRAAAARGSAAAGGVMYFNGIAPWRGLLRVLYKASIFKHKCEIILGILLHKKLSSTSHCRSLL